MSSNKLIVFHIVKWYPHKYDNLSGVFVKRHILSTLPYTVPAVLYAMATADIKGWYTIEETEEEGILTYRCYYKKEITGFKAFDKLIKLGLYFLLTLKMYRRAKKKIGKPDLVHTHVLLRTAVMAYMIKVLDHVPYVVLEHATRFIRKDMNAFQNQIERLFTRFVIRKSAGLITVSSSLGKAMIEKCNVLQHPFEVVYNCVDTSIFKPTVLRKELKEFVYVAEFNEDHKNISGLLRVIEALYKKRTDFIVRFVGYGKDEQKLQHYAVELGLFNSVVFFEGKKTGKELAQCIGQAEALLLFSNYENLPCVITEAFCCGVPVISTSVGGIAEIITPENGLLIDRGDEQAMLNAMNRLLDGKVVFHREQIKNNAHSLFSNDEVGLKLLNIYNRIVAC